MITGTHILVYSQKPELDREFFRDVLGFKSVDVGGGWLIFALPPAELGVHPGEFTQAHGDRQVLGAVVYFMCSDLKEEVRALNAKNVECSPVEEADWGAKTTIKLPSGGEIGLYQPRHQTAIEG